MDRTKYPRTMNFPWSGSNSSDDVWWDDCSLFEGKEVVVTEKMDGECTTIYPDGHVHARSVDSKHHPSRSHVKALAAQIAYKMGENIRLCGENVYAFHSIFYTELPSYFLAYGAYQGNTCLSWRETELLCLAFEVPTVPIIYKGIWDEDKIRNLWEGKGAYPTFSSPSGPPCEAEGYVVRVTEEFPYDEFRSHCAKYVRPNHVTTSSHWLEGPVVPNLLVENKPD